ncbi:hypothetical protein SK128_027922, partial [Halocaridina rubra]
MSNGTSTSQYINAVRMNNFNQADGIIVTEHPLPNTLSQAWRLMYEKNVFAWVILDTQPENEDTLKLYPPLLSEGESLQFEHLHIRSEDTVQYEDFRKIRVTLALRRSTASPTHIMYIYYLNGWPNNSDIPIDNIALIKLLDHIHHCNPSANQPIVFTCSDGVKACGVAATLENVLQRIQLQGEVDIYTAVQRILSARPQFITSW